MKDLSALTPPLLMAAIVVVAIIAFLRHEMARGRASQRTADSRSPATDVAEAAEGSGTEQRGEQHGVQAKTAASGPSDG